MWAYIPGSTIPTFDESEVSSKNFHVDYNTVTLHFGLWNSLNKIVSETQAPIREVRHLKLRAAVYWNAIKGSIDVLSRYIKNTQYPINGSPRQVYFIRMLKMIALNGFLTNQMIKCDKQIMEAKQYVEARRAMTKTVSFSNFMGKLARSFTIMREVGVSPSLSMLYTTPGTKPRMTSSKMDVFIEQINEPGRYSIEKFFTGEGKKFRTNSNYRHIPATLARRETCKFCSAKQPMQNIRTLTKCSACKVALCIKNRYDGQSCYEIWHSNAATPSRGGKVTEKLKKRKESSGNATDTVATPIVKKALFPAPSSSKVRTQNKNVRGQSAPPAQASGTRENVITSSFRAPGCPALRIITRSIKKHSLNNTPFTFCFFYCLFSLPILTVTHIGQKWS